MWTEDYGTVLQCLTIGENKLEKGSMPEPDMVNNNIGIYKDHEDNFQIMIIPKPKPKQKKKN